MKQYLIGFLLGVALCMFMGNKLYHPVRGIIVNSNSIKGSASYEDHITIMRNQESILNLIKNRCGE